MSTAAGYLASRVSDDALCIADSFPGSQAARASAATSLKMGGMIQSRQHGGRLNKQAVVCLTTAT